MTQTGVAGHEPDAGARLLFQLAAREGLQVRHLRPSVPTLEDVFARAVGEGESDAHP